MKRTIISLVMTGVLFAPPLTAGAGESEATSTCPERPNKPAKARKLAGVLFSEAEDAFDQGMYEKALERFVCSLVMMEHANTIINIEHTLDKIEDKSTALPILKTFSALRPDSEMKSKIDEMVSELEAVVAPAEKTAETPPCPEVQQMPPLPCPAAPEPVLEIEFRERAQKLLFITGWTSVGIGAASFITAVAFQVLAGSAKNKAQETVSYDVFLDERDKYRSFQVSATVTFVSGVLSAGVGVTQLFLLNQQQKKYTIKKQGDKDSNLGAKSDKPSVSFVPDIGQLGMEVTF